MKTLKEFEKGIEEKINLKFFKNNSINRKEYQNSEETFSKYLDYDVDKYFSHIKMIEWPKKYSRYKDKFKRFFKGNILELGSGSSKLSAMLSRENDVKSVTCVEFSETMLSKIAPRVFVNFKGDLSKAFFVISDMHEIKNFEDKKYDTIIFHASLHHVFLPYNYINNIKNILQNNGIILGLSEPCLPSIALPSSHIRKWILNQKRHQLVGNNENIYYVNQYKDFFTRFFDFKFKFVDINHVGGIKGKISNSFLSRKMFHHPLSINFQAELKS